jgi:hypothetical protein
MNAAQLYDTAFKNGMQLGYSAAKDFANRGLIYLVGYRSLTDGQGRWLSVHKWCKEHAGLDNYSWAGDTFAFRDPEIATMFKLRWG